MDSLEHQNSVGMKVWRVLFGGDQTVGRTKLFFVLIGYILVCGSFFAWMI